MESICPIAMRRLILRRALEPLFRSCGKSFVCFPHRFPSRSGDADASPPKMKGGLLGKSSLTLASPLPSPSSPVAQPPKAPASPRAAITTATGGFKQRKMDLEGMQRESAHTSRPLPSAPLHVPTEHSPPIFHPPSARSLPRFFWRC